MKTILITGGTENTGFRTACHFAEHGFCVAITSRDARRAQAAAEKIALQYHVQTKGYELDLSSTSSIETIFQKAEQDFHSLDVFVANSANLGIGCSILNTSPEDFDRIVEVNYRGTFFCCQNYAKIMCRQRRGNIVLIGSVQACGGVPGRAVYGSSKGALLSLNKYLAYELAEYGIRSNIIVAGAIHSSRWDSLSSKETANRRSRYPLGKEAETQDIANAVYYLGTDLSANVTGTELTIDAGLSTCLLPYQRSVEDENN